VERIKALIRDIPDFPKPGILFKDITPLLADPVAFRRVIETLSDHYRNQRIDQVVCVEARGFLIGAPLAYKLGAGIVPVRKPGKLPYDCVSATYSLEYGTDMLQMHRDALQTGSRVLIADDVLATGGTTAGVVDLIQKGGGEVAGVAVLMELMFLKGRERLKGQEVFSLLQY